MCPFRFSRTGIRSRGADRLQGAAGFSRRQKQPNGREGKSHTKYTQSNAWGDLDSAEPNGPHRGGPSTRATESNAWGDLHVARFGFRTRLYPIGMEFFSKTTSAQRGRWSEATRVRAVLGTRTPFT